MTTIEQRGEWLALLEAEARRRAVRAEWAAGEDERAAQQFVTELQTMAQRFAATAPLHPLQVDDMSIEEQLACHLLPRACGRWGCQPRPRFGPNTAGRGEPQSESRGRSPPPRRLSRGLGVA
jgi:hypothetical protein